MRLAALLDALAREAEPLALAPCVPPLAALLTD